MTNEEKAKAYDEAMNKIKPLYEQAKRDGNPIWSTYEYLVPELRESEDERTKRMLNTITYKMSQHQPDIFTEEENEWFNAYLEKQKEQPTNEEMLRTLRTEYEKGVADTIAKYGQKPIFRVGDTIIAKDGTDIPQEAFQIERIKDGYYWDKEGGSILISNQDEFQLVEQKPTDNVSREEYVKRFKVLCDAYEIKLPNRICDIYHLCDDLAKLFTDFGKQKPAEWSEDWREEDIQTRFAFYTYKDDLGVLYLSNVFVEEASRNHGFGTKILIAAEKVAETIGATTISLRVKQDSPANAWYRKRGYGYVAFEDGYDWLEKNLEYMKPNKQEWSEKDERNIRNLESILYYDKKLSEETRVELGNFLKSLRPPQDRCKDCPHRGDMFLLTQGIKSGKHELASEFMNYLDENRPEEKMNLSNAECKDIDEAFKECDWAKIMKYVEKYRPSWKPSEEQMNGFHTILYQPQYISNSDDDRLKQAESLYNDLNKLIQKDEKI